MGSVKKALKPITRVVDDIIPNEIKPALPYIAATFGAPYLAPASMFGSAALSKGITSALINAGTQVALGKDVNPVSAAVSGLTAGGGQFLGEAFPGSKLAQSTADFLSPGKVGDMTLGQVTAAATTPLTAGTAEAAYDAAKEAEEAYEKYLAEQEAANNEDIQTRVEFITRYLQNAGFDQDYIDTRLNELGYAANGGLMGTRVGLKEGSFVFDPRPGYGDRGRVLTVKDVVNPNDRFLKFLFPTEDFPKSKRQISEELEKAMKDSDEKDDGMMARDDRIGLLFNLIQAQQALGDEADLDKIREYEAELADLMGSRKTAAEGGIMNLKVGGKPAEMDLRGGGFVPIGAKEKADDVPARLSKNEFVMTADAVRAAGGGSVNKGAKRMYDLMNKLEARV
tara:strand:+ start:94 stop:1281 length:1188 start_codon:yes stop_codon:yes gene_type:complete